MDRRILVLALLIILLFGLYWISIKIEQEDRLLSRQHKKVRRSANKKKSLSESEESMNKKILINEISDSDNDSNQQNNTDEKSVGSFTLVSNKSSESMDNDEDDADNESLASFKL